MVLSLSKTLDKKLCDLNYAKCAHWKKNLKNVKKKTNIKNDDKAKLLNHVGKAVIIFCIKLFCIKFATMYIIVEIRLLNCYVMS